MGYCVTFFAPVCAEVASNFAWLDARDSIVYIHLIANLSVWGMLLTNLYFFGRGVVRQSRLGAPSPFLGVIALSSTLALGIAGGAYTMVVACVRCAPADRQHSAINGAILSFEHRWFILCAAASAVGYVSALILVGLRWFGAKRTGTKPAGSDRSQRGDVFWASDDGKLLRRFGVIIGVGALYVVVMPLNSLAIHPLLMAPLLLIGFLWANRSAFPRVPALAERWTLITLFSLLCAVVILFPLANINFCREEKRMWKNLWWMARQHERQRLERVEKKQEEAPADLQQHGRRPIRAPTTYPCTP